MAASAPEPCLRHGAGDPSSPPPAAGRSPGRKPSYRERILVLAVVLVVTVGSMLLPESTRQALQQAMNDQVQALHDLELTLEVARGVP
jgi:hypothetical protein